MTALIATSAVTTSRVSGLSRAGRLRRVDAPRRSSGQPAWFRGSNSKFRVHNGLWAEGGL